MELLESFTFHPRERRTRKVLVSISLFIFIVSFHSSESRRIDTLAQAFIIQAQPDSAFAASPSAERLDASSSSSFFRRNLVGHKKRNQQVQSEHLEEGRSLLQDDNHRYSYFHNDEDEDEDQQPLASLQPLRISKSKSKFTTALLTRSLPSYRRPSSAAYASKKKLETVAGSRKHVLSFGGDDSAEENSFQGHFDEEEDPHLHQERFKSSQYVRRQPEDGELNEGDDVNEDDEASSELGRYSLVNSYFDNEYSLRKLHEMECITPTKSKGYCSTFRACVPSLFTATGELEAPALAELISFSIGYCTMDANAASSSNVLLKRAGHRFAEVANRIICCPGSPPASGGEPSAEESAEKFNDFLKNKGPQLGSFEEDDEDKTSLGNPGILTSGESVIWTSKEKKPAPLKTIQTSVKVTPPPPSSSEDFNEAAEGNQQKPQKSPFAPAIVQDEPVSFEKEQLLQESSPQTESSQERPPGQLEDSSEDTNGPQEIPIEAFLPPQQEDNSVEIFPPGNSESSLPLSHSPPSEEELPVAADKPADSNDTDEDIEMHGHLQVETSTVISTSSSSSSVLSSNSRRNSSFIQIQPEPVVGANGKFTLENGVYIEKATSATPRPKPNPSHQATIGETTVNIIKTEVPVDSNSVSFQQKLPTKPYSSKIPSSGANPITPEDQQSQPSHNDDDSGEDKNEANDFSVETTTSSLAASDSSSSSAASDSSSSSAASDSSSSSAASDSSISSAASDSSSSSAASDSSTSSAASASSEAVAATTVVGETGMYDESNVDAVRDESELHSTTTSSSDESEKPVGVALGDSSESSSGANDIKESTIAPAQDDESFLPSTTKVYSGEPGESSGGPQKETTASSETTLLPATASEAYFPESGDNTLSDDRETTSQTTSKTFSSEESSSGSYDVNPTTSAYEFELQHSDHLIQTTIPAGHYNFQDEVQTTTRPNSSPEAPTMQTSLFEDSAEDENSLDDSGKVTTSSSDRNTEASVYPTTTKNEELGSTFLPVVPEQSGDVSPTTESPLEVSGGIQQDESQRETTQQPLDIATASAAAVANEELLSSILEDEIAFNKKPPGHIQLFLGKEPGKYPGNAAHKPVQPFLEGNSEETSPIPAVPTTQIPPKGHEDDSMESERDAPYPGAPNKWAIGQLHSQSDNLASSISPPGGAPPSSGATPPSSGESGSHESNELQEGGVNDDDSHSVEHNKVSSGAAGSAEDSHATSSEEEKKGSSSSVELEDPHSAHIHDDKDNNSLEESGESLSSSEVPTTTALPYGPVEDEPTTLAPPPPPQMTLRPPVTPESGGVQFKPPQDSSGEAPVPVGSQPQFQILSACATKDYYRSLETDNSKHYPFLATIVGGSRPFCSGSLITDRHILTAAHFLSNITVSDVFHMRVHIGYRSSLPGQTEGPFVVRKVLKVIRHKSFSFEKLVNDVAILILDRPVRFNEDVHPVCLSHSRAAYAAGDAEALETGWVEDPLIKKISPHHPYVDEHIVKYFTFGYKNITWSLHAASTVVKSNAECAANYAFLEKSGIVIRDSMVCAAPAESKEVCSFKGNSGAPLFLANDGSPVQIGLVSWGIGCGHFPAVFTSVSSFIPWIEKVVARTS